ncbi:RAB11-binding protein RELCH homolog [Microplitis mediator]|uniref:RAB11-binding protein RELCH homolog n=1 Tax=Microplitis mediator TaxID=375433 RepID=UPI00255269BE|nr:RAB11-binding protein RELCH homolog [Microplitis mediator]
MDNLINNLPSNSTSINIKLSDTSSVSYNDIATKLLSEKLLLTALELHAELCESGKELPILRDYFSNSNNFDNSTKNESFVSIARSSSQATLDSLDMTRYSEDDGGVDERVAVLEFELRKARENISALRANLTVVTESATTSPDKKNNKQFNDKCLSIKPHEQRALNYLVYEYLLSQSYKLTSITFSDENENQDFEDWDDVGLNIPKPPNLLQIYREFLSKTGYDKPPSIDASTQTDFVDEQIEVNDDNPTDEINEQKEQLNASSDEFEFIKQQSLDDKKNDTVEFTKDCNDQSNECNEQNNDNNKIIINSVASTSTTPEKLDPLDSVHQETLSCSQEPDEDDSISISAVMSLEDTDPGDKDWTKVQLSRLDIPVESSSSSVFINLPSRFLPERFKEHILSYSSVNTSSTGVQMVDDLIKNNSSESLINLLAKSLLIVSPNIISTKREEVIPLLIKTIRVLPKNNDRDKLLQLLFNLKKKPHQEERRVLLKALITAIKMDGVPPEPEELITLCWEQSQHKYPERRLLAVECCSVLAPYTSNAVRNSLIISMLQQILLDDKETVVRVAVIRSLALLVALTDDPDKYFQFEELTLTALDDESTQVFQVASNLLLPTLAQWALSLKRLLSHLMSRILSRLKNNFVKADKLNSKYSQSKDSRNDDKIIRLIDTLKILLPHIIVFMADNETVKNLITEDTPSEVPKKILNLCPSSIMEPVAFSENPDSIGKILNIFITNDWEEMWPEFEWLTKKLIPDIVEMLKLIDLTQENVLNNLLMYIQSMCNGFGINIVQHKIKKLFEDEVMECEQKLMALSDNSSISMAFIPAYLLILSTLDPQELSKILKHFIIMFSINGLDINSLIITIKILCKQPDIVEEVVSALWEGVVHQRAVVRCTTGKLIGNIIGNIDDKLVISRVAPAIVTLASDGDITVKAAAVTALGKLITDCTASQVRDKGRLTLESIVKDPQGVSQALTIPLITTFTCIAPNCSQHYIEDVIAPHLAGITVSASQQTQKAELTTVLLDAYSVLVYSSLSDRCITGVLLPGLKYLETLTNQLLPHQRDSVKSLIREAESRHNTSKNNEKTTFTSSPLSLPLTSTNVGQGVEDMRQRMTKMFSPKPTSPGITNIFRKK